MIILNAFQNEIEQTAIERIKKFSYIALNLGYEVAVGFSGGKDSQVIYDLCLRSGIKFTAYFNHSFEDSTTLKFIREFYPEVVWRRDYNYGFIQNIWQNHNSILPTVELAYCCQDYKHNPLYVDNASIVGVRKEESKKRKLRTTFEVKNKTTLKQHKPLFSKYFSENCTSTGTNGIIQLKPIIDWSSDDVFSYIKLHNLPLNPNYKTLRRVGCIVCPKANFSSNYVALLQHPKLIDAFIKAREKRKDIDWIINNDGIDYSDNKVEYICRWLNHSFRPFTVKQKIQYQHVFTNYMRLKK